MKSYHFSIRLLEDLVISERAATLGGHQSLSYLPGATLLGASAARLYAKLTPADAYTCYHAGHVRFGNGLPLADNGSLGYPMPLCLHEAKENPAIKDSLAQADRVWNFLHCSGLPGDSQPKQLRDGFLTQGGEVIKPERLLRMKTAIDPDSGRAAEQQLFGYESLREGQVFAATLHIDTKHVEKDLAEKLLDSLRGMRRLGRSRSAEYGRVEIERMEAPQAIPSKGGGRAIVWLLSDLALHNEFGQPTLAPANHHFGLPPGQLLPEKSFMHARNYAPFNGHYQRHELERQVLSMGSVLYFELDDVLDDTQAEEITRRGAGLYRQTGLGAFLLNPPLLETEAPVFTAAVEKIGAAPEPRSERPASLLLDWLVTREVGDSQRRSDRQQAYAFARELETLYDSARRLGGLPPGEAAGPSPSQWGRVLEAARHAGNGGELSKMLFMDDDAICKENDAEWSRQFMHDGNVSNYSHWLEKITRNNKLHDKAYVLATLANRARADLLAERDKTREAAV